MSFSVKINLLTNCRVPEKRTVQPAGVVQTTGVVQTAGIVQPAGISKRRNTSQDETETVSSEGPLGSGSGGAGNEPKKNKIKGGGFLEAEEMTDRYMKPSNFTSTRVSL